MTKNPMTAALMALAMLAPTAALADLWSDTPIRDADMYFNQILMDLDLDITELAFVRQNCKEGDGTPDSASCSLFIVPTAYLNLEGTSLDEPPTSMTFILANVDEVLPMVQAITVLTASTSPDVSSSDRNKIIPVFSSVVELRSSEDVEIGDTNYLVAHTPDIGMGISMVINPIE